MIVHPAVDAVRLAKRRLHQIMTPSGIPGPPTHRHKDTKLAAAVAMVPAFKPKQIDRMLRVEITAEALDTLLRGQERVDLIDLLGPLQGLEDGPIQIEGVDWYLVTRLPTPGWRVIDPLLPA